MADANLQIKMKHACWLKLEAVFSFLLGAGHSFGGLQHWSPAGETPVLQAMGNIRFDASGSIRSYLDFYLGFGYMISVYRFGQAILVWQMATPEMPQRAGADDDEHCVYTVAL